MKTQKNNLPLYMAKIGMKTYPNHGKNALAGKN